MIKKKKIAKPGTNCKRISKWCFSNFTLSPLTEKKLPWIYWGWSIFFRLYNLVHFYPWKGDNYTPRKHSLGGYIGIGLSVCLSGPTSKSFVRFPPNFVEFKIMTCELCSTKDFIVHWVLPLLCLFGLICNGSIKIMGTRGVLVPRSGQLSYSIYVSKRDSCVQQYL